MFDLESPVGIRLRRSRVQVRSADGDTLVLHRVPANERFFTKPRTNLLFQRPRKGAPLLIGVDDDLDYTGSDPVLQRAFAGGVSERGWRVLFVDDRGDERLDAVVEDALAAVGFDGVEPSWRQPAPPVDRAEPAILQRFGTDLSTRPERASDSIARKEAIAVVTSILLQRASCLPVVVGESGAGKSHLLHVVAARWCALIPGRRLIRMDLGRLFSGTSSDAEREKLLQSLLDAAGDCSDVGLAIERLDLAIAETRHGALALSHALEAGRKIVGTSTTSDFGCLAVPALARYLRPVPIDPLPVGDACELVRAMLPEIAAAHRVGIDAADIPALVHRAASLQGNLPATALALLDAACARARVDGASSVELEHVYVAASAFADRES